MPDFFVAFRGQRVLKPGGSRVKATDYRHLEKCLCGCEKIATDLSTWSPRDLEIRDEIRAVLQKVVVERIRAEERESRPAAD